MPRLTLLAWLALAPAALTPAALAASPAHKVVLELFTSESCSSCPPAEDLLAELARTRPDVIVLGMHVDYWNRLGWQDRFTLPGATQRQRDYAGTLGAGVYTPQLVADGRFQAVGSDREAVLAAIAQSIGAQHAGPAMALTEAGGAVHVQLGAGEGGGTVLLAGFDNSRSTSVGGGENAGHVVTDAQPVRSLKPLGAWQGQEVAFTAPRPQGAHLVAFLQAADGAIVAVATPNS